MTRLRWRALACNAVAAALGPLWRLGANDPLVVYHAWPDFARKSAALADLLRRHELPVSEQTGTTFMQCARIRASRALWIGYWNTYPIDSLPARLVFLNGEPLTVADEWRDDPSWFRAMRAALEVWTYTRADESVLSAAAIPWTHVPFGYAPYYEESFAANTAGKNLIEDIDVLFVGGLSQRRERTLAALAARGMRVQTITRGNPLHGAQLDEVLARARIVLAVHRLDDPKSHGADFARLDHLLSNRRFVIHEKLSASNADPAFERNVTTCAYDEIPATCERFLAEPLERERIAQVAYQWFKAERPLDAFIPYDHVRRFLAGG